MEFAPDSGYRPRHASPHRLLHRLLCRISTTLNSLGFLLRGLTHRRANRRFTLADLAGTPEGLQVKSQLIYPAAERGLSTSHPRGRQASRG
jgi:hypothetical protein